jgi:hypothetical protein
MRRKGESMTHALSRPGDFFDQKYGMDSQSLQRILDTALSPHIKKPVTPFPMKLRYPR